MSTEKKQSLESLSTGQLTQLLLHMDQQPEEKIQTAIDLLRERSVDVDEVLREARIRQCSTCLLRQMDMQQGLVCSTTGERGSYVGKCAQYKYDQKAEKAEIAASAKSGSNGQLWLNFYLIYLVVDLIAHAFFFLKWQQIASFYYHMTFEYVFDLSDAPLLVSLTQVGFLAIFLYYTYVIMAVMLRRPSMIKLAYVQCGIAIVYQLCTGIAGMKMIITNQYASLIIGLIITIVIPICAIALLYVVQSSHEINKSDTRLNVADIVIMVISIVGVVLGIVGAFALLSHDFLI